MDKNVVYIKNIEDALRRNPAMQLDKLGVFVDGRKLLTFAPMDFLSRRKYGRGFLSWTWCSILRPVLWPARHDEINTCLENIRKAHKALYMNEVVKQLNRPLVGARAEKKT